MTMLDRIEVDIIEVMFQVIIVRDKMLPIPALPETLFTFRDP